MAFRVELKIICDVNGKPQSGIVRLTMIEDEKIVIKYGLNNKGGWNLIPEGGGYPDECLLPVIVSFKETHCLNCRSVIYVGWDQGVEEPICARCEMAIERNMGDDKKNDL
jgi:hypothetical protein